MDKRHEKNKNTNKRMEDIKYCRALKDFLNTFKTIPCSLKEEHCIEYCPYYHSYNDKRRSPYLDSGFLYYLDQQCFCDLQVHYLSSRTAPTIIPTTNTPSTHMSIKRPCALVTPAMHLQMSVGCFTRGNPAFSNKENSLDLISRHSKR